MILRIVLIGLALVVAGCVSQDHAIAGTPITNREFPLALVGKPFFTAPARVSVTGEPSEYGSAPVEDLWLNAIQGGVSGSHYQYFMFRWPGLAGKGQIDIVFFDDDALGFYVPAQVTSAAIGGAVEFTINRKLAGGEGFAWKSILRFNIARDSVHRLSASIDSNSQLSTLFIPAGRRHWVGRMEFAEAAIAEETVTAARKISLKIKREE
jgi:hypothetical protein